MVDEDPRIQSTTTTLPIISANFIRHLIRQKKEHRLQEEQRKQEAEEQARQRSTCFQALR